MVRKNRKTVTKELVAIIASMIEAKKDLRQISATVGLSARTIIKIIKDIKNGKEFKPAGKKLKETFNQKNSLFTDVDQIIYNSITCNNSLTQQELKAKVEEQSGDIVSISTICRKLKKMNFTRKRLSLIPEERNTVDKIEARAIYAADIMRIRDDNLIFLDETGFNLHTRRSYGYSLTNEKAFITLPANRAKNRSLLCAIGVSGVIDYEYKVGGYNSKSFIDFINTKLASYFLTNPNAILIMDNAPFHKSRNVLSALRNNNITYKFLVAYSPQLNPIEEFFSMLKSRYCALKNQQPGIAIEVCMDMLLSNENNYSTVFGIIPTYEYVARKKL